MLFIMSVSPLQAAECTPAPAVPVPGAPQSEFLRAYPHDFSSPVRLAVDAAGSVYIADPKKGEVIVRAQNGRVLQHRRDLGRPGAVAVDAAGNVYLADLDNGLVSVFDADWRLSHRFAGADMQQAGDMAIDDARSRVYISDSEAHRIRVYSTAGESLFEFGSPGEGDGQFRYPSGLFVDAANDEVLVSDQFGYRVLVFDPDGLYKYCIGGSSANPGGVFQRGRLLAAPQGLWADALGRIYVADSFEGQGKVIDPIVLLIQIFHLRQLLGDRTGQLLTTIGSFGQAGGELRIPADVVMDSLGRLYVASANNARVEMFGIDEFTDPEQYTPALLEIDPDQVDAGSSGILNALFKVPALRLSDIHDDSIRLNGLPPVSLRTVDIDGDAEFELLAGFSLAAVLETLPPSGTAQVQLQAASETLTVDGSARIEVVAVENDHDGDSVPDDVDRCPDTAQGDSVDADGCALAQYCACTDFKNHGLYVSCVARTSRRFVLEGILDTRQRAQAIRAAAHSECSRGRGHTHASRSDESVYDENDISVQDRDALAADNRPHDDLAARGGRGR